LYVGLLAFGLAFGCSLSSLNSLTSGGGDDAGTEAGQADAGVDVVDAPGPIDTGVDAGDGAVVTDAANTDAREAGGCGTAVVVAGSPNASNPLTYLASSVDGGPWNQVPAPVAMTTMPTIVPTATGFAAVFSRGDGVLVLATYTSATSTWSMPLPLPSSPPLLLSSPSASSLALLDGGLHVVTRGNNAIYYDLAEGSPWTGTPIQNASVGPVGPTVANVAGSLVAALDVAPGDASVDGGMDAGVDGDMLYDDTFVAGVGAWTTGSLPLALGGTASPRIVALSANAFGADAALFYQDPGHQLNALVRINGAWTSPMPLAALLSNVGSTDVDFATTALPSGGVGLVFIPGVPAAPTPEIVLFGIHGGNQSLLPMLAEGFAPGGPVLPATPTIAKGVCGDVAIVAYATGDAAEVVHVAPGGALRTEPAVATGSVTFAAIATLPP
jgi:hypothetical protein